MYICLLGQHGTGYIDSKNLACNGPRSHCFEGVKSSRRYVRSNQLAPKSAKIGFDARRASGIMSSNTSRTARAAIALKSGVVMGGTAILSAVNGLTPHMAGAIDIMVVQQADGTLKCSPFYVRFGKYTPMRSKDKKVHILINGEEAVFHMHLGAYGQAYFAAETMEIVSDAEEEQLLQGMMSPPSGYSSDEDAPYANEEILSAVQQEVQRIKDSQLAAQQEQAEHAVPGSQPADPAVAAAAAKAPAGSEELHELIEQDGVGAEVSNAGSESDSSSGSNNGSNSSSSSGLDDLPSTSEITSAIQQGLAAGKIDRAARHSRRSGRRAGGTGASAGDSSAASAGRPGSSRKHRRKRPSRTRVILDAPGDGAAADPARTNLQDLLLDNRYSIKVKSDESFTADGLEQEAAAVQHLLHGKSRLQQEQHPEVDDSEGSSLLQQQEQEQPRQEQQQQQGPVRHVGFEVTAHPKPPRGPSSTSVQKEPHSELAGVLDPAASYSIDEVSGFTSSAAAAAADADAQQSSGSISSDSSVEGPAAAAVVSAAVAAVIAANEPAPVAAPATTASPETTSGAAAAVNAVAAANAAVKAQALAAVRESYDRAAAAAAAEDDGLDSEIVAMPTLSDGIAVPGSATIDAVQQHSPSPSTLRTSLLASSLREAEMQEQQQQQQQQQHPSAEQHQQQEDSVSSSSSNTVGSEGDALALLEDVADTAGAAAETPFQQSQMNGFASPVAVPPPSQTPVETSAIPATNFAAGAASTAAAGAASLPLAVPTTPLGSSLPVESGYLGDTEHDRALGTSYEGAPTPHGSIPVDHLAPGAGPLALGLAGFQLSLCGGDLRVAMGAGEAQQVFEAGRITAQMWSEKGVSLLEDANLVVKIGGSLYSWKVAAPMVVGMLAFGGKWDTLLGLDPTGMYPIKVADDHSITAKKASSSWRLWPFTVWRDGSKTIPAPGSSPPAAAAGSTAKTPPPAEKTSSGGLVPSGGSFSNSLKLNLLGSGSKSAPALAGLEPQAVTAVDSSSASAAAAAGPAAVEGASPRGSPRIAASGASFLSTGSSPSRPGSRKKHIIIIRKTLTPTSEQLSLLPLKPGSNTITFRATGAADLTAYIYLLRWNTRLVVSDVDGTITRSDLLGHVLPTLGVDWSHLGITQLFHNIDRNGYQIMFLSSRAIAQANITREYLHTLVQDGYKMPSGPVIISPHGLLPSLYREIVVRRPHEFKIACLQDIRALFPPDWNPFYAGFGNRDTDEVSYKMVGVPVSRTFTINPRGQIQKASTALQSSTWSSLSAINDLVDEIFPPLPAAALRNSGRALRQQQSSIGRSDWELAAKGLVGDDVLEAAIAEQQRRRSSSTGGPVTVGAVANTAGGEVADQKAGVDTGDSSGAAGNDSSKVVAAPANILADGTTAAAVAPAPAATAVTHKAGGSGSVSQADQQAGPLELEIEDVGPAREEFSDLQFWKTSVTFSIDIEEELKRVEKSQQQKQQQQQQPLQLQQQTKK